MNTTDIMLNVRQKVVKKLLERHEYKAMNPQAALVHAEIMAAKIVENALINLLFNQALLDVYFDEPDIQFEPRT
jgi:hypothetical protein